MPDRPQTPSHAVDRPDLRRLLDLGVESPLTVIVAPAGSGKTVLLSQWVASRTDLLVGWFELTRADGDAVRLAQRLATGLASLDPALGGLGAPLGELRGGLGEPFLDAVSSALAEVDSQVVMVIDDLHTVHNLRVVEDIWALADRIPANAHLVVSARVDPGARWSRRRLQQSIVEIRGAQLAFDQADTALLLGRVSGGTVAAEVAAAVQQRTEGWAAGIQLAGLTLRSRPATDDAVTRLAGSDRLIVEYLGEEVLDAQEPERLAALLRLSVPDEVHVDMLPVVVPFVVPEVAVRPAASDLLADLERESLFLVAVPDRPGWFRFHPLFRDVLRLRLRARNPGAEEETLRALASWYLARDDVPNAIECLLRARRWPEAMDLILARGREAFERGHLATVTHWLNTVPDSARASRPDAELLRGITLGMSGKAVEAVDILQAVSADRTLDAGRRTVAHAYLGAAVQFRPNPEVHLREALLSLKLLGDHPDLELPSLLQLTGRDLLAALSLGSVGRAHLLMGDLAAAEIWLERARRSRGGQYAVYQVHVLGSLAIVHALAGELNRASALSAEALGLASEASLLTHPAPADAHLAAALVGVQRNGLHTGALNLREGMLRASSNARTELQWLGYLTGRLAYRTDTDTDVAQPGGPPPPVVRTRLEALDLMTARHRGEPRSPRRPVKDWSPLAFEEIAALLTGGDATAARRRLEEIPMADDSATLVSKVERETLLAWLEALERRSGRSRAHLTRAIDLAEPEGLEDVFVRAGGPVPRLIDELPGAPSPFRRSVVQRARRVARPPSEGHGISLTARERDLLAYLPTRLSTAEIANRSYVSRNTVKTHLMNIYSKLGVQSRDAAVARATDLGLLDIDSTAVGQVAAPTRFFPDR